MALLKFKSKKQIHNYILNKFSKNSGLLLIHGSASNSKNKLKAFSDIDLESYNSNPKKPHYEIVLLKTKPILISVYYYKYKKGKKISPRKDMKILYGTLTSNIMPEYKKGKFTGKDKVRRECQLVADFIFKYIRSKEIKYLEYVQKRL